MYHLGKISIPQSEIVNVISESHTPLISGYFGAGKIVIQLQKFCYWPRMNDTVPNYVKGCAIFTTSNPSNRKSGLYTQVSVHSHPS